MKITLYSLLLVFAVLGCGEQVCGPSDQEEPNGYCELDDDCAETDFCLVDWCDGPCRPFERCVPRVAEGDWCDRDEMCAEGLSCGVSDEFDVGECLRPQL